MKLALTALLALPLPLLAQETLQRAAEAAVDPAAVDPMSSGYLLKLIIGLMMVLALIFLFAWAARKMRLTPSGQQGLIRVLSAIHVGQRDRIALIQVGEEQILIGLSPGRMQTLHTLKKPLAPMESSEGEEGGFAERLQQFMKKGRN
jgi:flagellar protein FliO/FliZ